MVNGAVCPEEVSALRHHERRSERVGIGLMRGQSAAHAHPDVVVVVAGVDGRVVSRVAPEDNVVAVAADARVVGATARVVRSADLMSVARAG